MTLPLLPMPGFTGSRKMLRRVGTNSQESISVPNSLPLAFLLSYQSLPLPRSREKPKISAFIMFILHIAPLALRHKRTDLAHERPMTPHAQLLGVDLRFPEVGEQEARHRIPALQDSRTLLL